MKKFQSLAELRDARVRRFPPTSSTVHSMLTGDWVVGVSLRGATIYYSGARLASQRFSSLTTYTQEKLAHALIKLGACENEVVEELAQIRKWDEDHWEAGTVLSKDAFMRSIGAPLTKRQIARLRQAQERCKG